MKIVLKSALFLMPLAVLNVGAVEPAASSALRKLASFQRSTKHSRVFAHKNKEYETQNWWICHELSTLVKDSTIPAEKIEYILSNASQILSFSRRSCGNATEDFITFFDPETKTVKEYVYRITRPWSLTSKLFLLGGGVGTLAGAYYYRDSLKPMVQHFWTAQLAPRITSFAEYAKQFSFKKLS